MIRIAVPMVLLAANSIHDRLRCDALATRLMGPTDQAQQPRASPDVRMRFPHEILCLGHVVVSIVVVACTGPTPVLSEGVERRADGIQGGEDDTNDPAVVGVLSSGEDGSGLCTGSLIAPNLVLTAQHCVASSGSQYVDCETTTFGPPYPPNGIAVTTQWNGLAELFNGGNVKLHFASEVIIPPGGHLMCGRDVALVVLEGAGIPPTEALPINPRVDEDVVAMEEYRAVGYGATSANGGGSGYRRTLGGLQVTCAGNCYSPGIDPLTEWLGDTGVCSGDSGGPALDLQGRVVGVVSRGGNLGTMCTTPVYGSVYGWRDWIKQQAVHAAAVGGYEPAPWVTGGTTQPETDAGAIFVDAGPDSADAGEGDGQPEVGELGMMGAPCASGNACRSGLCASDGYCTVACDITPPNCASGMRCDFGSGVCVYVDAPEPCVGDCVAPEASGVSIGGGCTMSRASVGWSSVLVLGMLLLARGARRWH